MATFPIKKALMPYGLLESLDCFSDYTKNCTQNT